MADAPDRHRAKTSGRKIALAAATAIGTVAAGIFGAVKLGWLDGALRRRGGTGHPAPDLTLDAPTPGTTRAPEAFRPDPTAAVPTSEREGLRPSTGAAPTPGKAANQTGGANG